MTGRKPLGPKLVQNLEGPKQAKDRLEVMLETLTGKLSIEAACERLGIGEKMFHHLRKRALRGALETLEPRRRGRPKRQPSPAEQACETLSAQVTQLQSELKFAQLRHDIDNILPVKVSAQEELALKKKKRRKERRNRNRRPR